LTPTLIYCAGGNAKLTQIAYEEGWALGCRSDKWHYPYPLEFVDIDYKKPDFEAHLKRVAKERPKFATVPDLSDKEVSELDIERAVAQANRLKDYCEIVLVVPKLSGQIEMLPAELAIGYSVPTSYGGAQFPIWELTGRRVHLLGGNPHEQIKLYRYIQSIGQVLSCDGNLAQKIAVERCKFWRQGGRNGGQWIDWPVVGDSQYYQAFRESCRNIRQAWQKETAQAA
jgi:hypothetical protein